MGAVIRAATRWNEFAGHRIITIDLSDRPYCTILTDNNMDRTRQAEWRHAPATIAVRPPGGWFCNAASQPGFDITCYETIIMHEMGHMLGMDHRYPGIMQAMGTTSDFTSTDRDQCIAIGVCDLNGS